MIEYIFDPIIEQIYSMNDTPVFLHTGYGRTVIFNLKGNYIKDICCYSKMADRIYRNKLAVIIRPRWSKRTLQHSCYVNKIGA